MANKNFKEKEEFIIFADVPPIPSLERLQKYKEAGFTYYNLTEDYVVRDTEDGKISDEYFNVIKDANAVGLKTILRTMRSNSPDYYDNVGDEFVGKADGYYIVDEPSYTYVSWYGSAPLDKLPKLVDWYNAHGGNSFFHINLLQDYGMWIVHGKTNTPNYENYLDDYIETVLKKVKGEKSLSTDHYPMCKADGVNYIKETAVRDYFRIAERTKKLIAEGHDVRTGFCIQLTSDTGLKMRLMECAEDITFQANLALCFGAKLLEYYLYVGRGTGIITDKETQLNYSPLYDWVKRANGQVNAIGKYYLPFEWVGAKTYAGTLIKDAHNLEAFELCKGKEIKSFALIKDFTSTADAIVSEFKDGDRTAYMALNYTEPTLYVDNVLKFTFDFDGKVTVIINGVPQEYEICGGELSLTLKAGESAFVLFD